MFACLMKPTNLKRKLTQKTNMAILIWAIVGFFFGGLAGSAIAVCILLAIRWVVLPLMEKIISVMEQ